MSSNSLLEEARDELEQAVKTAEDDVREEIRETADALRDYVVGDQQPDHAIIDAHLNELRQARERATGETADRLDSALEATEEYRTGLEQV